MADIVDKSAADQSAAKPAAKAEAPAAVMPKPVKAHGPADDAKAAKAGRLAEEARAEAEQAELNLVAEGPLNGYDHARALAQTDPEA